MNRPPGHDIDGSGKAREAPRKEPEPVRKVVPIVFVPGIAGSILKIKPNLEEWVREKLEIENGKSLPSPWNPPTGPFSLAIQWSHWKELPPRWRQVLLNPEFTEVDTGGFLEGGTKGLSDSPHHSASLPFKGWKSVYSFCYYELLNFLNIFENSSNDTYSMNPIKLSEDFNEKDLPYFFKIILENSTIYAANSLKSHGLEFCKTSLTTLKKVLAHCCPVYAIGYNWLKTNDESAEYLMAQLKKIKIIYSEARSPEGHPIFSCEKVILVTHSMGGLVASAAAPMDTDNLIGGIVYITVPAAGAPETYRNLAGGTPREVPEGHPLEMMKNMAAIMMGLTNKETTPIIANSPGCLQLLPSPNYPWKWLVATDPAEAMKPETLFSLPREDPYEEIYLNRDKWYSPVDPSLVDPAMLHGTGMNGAWNNYRRNVYIAQNFHAKLTENRITSIPSYACYGQDKRRLSFGKINWQLRNSTQKTRRHSRLAISGKLVDSTGAMRTTRHGGPDSEEGQNLYWHMTEKDSAGDTTVPWQSAISINSINECKEIRALQGLEHQTAGDNYGVQMFTLWSICKIIEGMKC